MENLISGKWADWKLYRAGSQAKWCWTGDFQITGRIYYGEEEACWTNTTPSRTFKTEQS